MVPTHWFFCDVWFSTLSNSNITAPCTSQRLKNQKKVQALLSFAKVRIVGETSHNLKFLQMKRSWDFRFTPFSFDNDTIWKRINVDDGRYWGEDLRHEVLRFWTLVIVVCMSHISLTYPFQFSFMHTHEAKISEMERMNYASGLAGQGNDSDQKAIK